MWAVKNTSNEVLSIHTHQADAEASKTRLGGGPLAIVEDTKINLVALIPEQE